MDLRGDESDNQIEDVAKTQNHIGKYLAVSVLLLVLVSKTTFASNINLGSDSRIEFGQGVLYTTACDDSVTLTPTTEFVNKNTLNNISAANQGQYMLKRFVLSGIDSSPGKCADKIFKITFYGENSAVLDAFYIHDRGSSFTSGSTIVSYSFGDVTNQSVNLIFPYPNVLASELRNVTVQSFDATTMPENDSRLNQKIFLEHYCLPSPVSTAQWSYFSRDGNWMMSTSKLGFVQSINTSSGSSWTKTSISGANNIIFGAVNGDGSKMYVGDNAGRGIWKSSDYGVSWQTITDPQSINYGIGNMATDSTGDYFYVAIGDIWRSSNGGASFTAAPNTSGHQWVGLETSSDGRYVVASATDGIFYSSNFGSSFTKIYSLTSTLAETLRISDNGQFIYFVKFNGDTVFTADGGNTWTVHSSNDLVMAAASDEGNVLLASINLNGMSNALSFNMGASWTRLGNSLDSGGGPGAYVGANGQKIVTGFCVHSIPNY